MAGQEADVLAFNSSGKENHKKKNNYKEGLPFRRRAVCCTCEPCAALATSVRQLLRLEEALWTVDLPIYVNRVLPQLENNLLAENSLLRDRVQINS